jgi:hypothetical protein
MARFSAALQAVGRGKAPPLSSRLAHARSVDDSELCEADRGRGASMKAFATSLIAMLVTSACVSTKESLPLGANASTALTRCILVEAQRIAPKAINLDAAAML